MSLGDKLITLRSTRVFTLHLLSYIWRSNVIVLKITAIILVLHFILHGYPIKLEKSRNELHALW